MRTNPAAEERRINRCYPRLSALIGGHNPFELRSQSSKLAERQRLLPFVQPLVGPAASFFAPPEAAAAPVPGPPRNRPRPVGGRYGCCAGWLPHPPRLRRRAGTRATAPRPRPPARDPSPTRRRAGRLRSVRPRSTMGTGPVRLPFQPGPGSARCTAARSTGAPDRAGRSRTGLATHDRRMRGAR